MTRSVANRAAWQDEQGALLVLTAVLVPALVLLGALTFGVTSLWASHDDVQRSADLGSAAGAAITPTAVVTPGAATLPVPIEGKSFIHKMTDALDPGSWQDRACTVAYGELGNDRSFMTRGFAGDGYDPECVSTWQPESPTLEAVGACAGDLLDVSGCASRLRTNLASTIPALDAASQDVTDAMTTAQNLAADFTNPVDKLMTAAAAKKLPGGCTKVVTSLLGGFTCIQHASDVLNPLVGVLSNTLGIAPTGTPQFGVNLDQLLPAVMTPRVSVYMHRANVRPALSPLTFDVTSTAVARRTIKTALVLPSGAIPSSEITADLDAHFAAAGSGASLTLKAAAGVGGYVIDPNILTRSTNARVDRTLALADRLDNVLDRPIVNSFITAACNSGIPSKYCPIINTDDATRQMGGQFIQDLRDATRPPPQGAQPSLNQWLSDAADAGSPVLLLQTLTPRNLKQIFGATAWSVLTDPTINPALAPLLSDLMYIPALDVLPATVGRVVIGPKTFYVLRPIAMDTLATKGLYQARLVK